MRQSHVCHRKAWRIHRACVRPGLSINVSVCLSHMEKGACVCVCVFVRACAHFSTTERKRLPAARLWQCWAAKLPKPCAQRCHGNRGLQDWDTHIHTHEHVRTHAKHILSHYLFSPHTHSCSGPAAEQCRRNTEEPACLSWREALHRIRKIPGKMGEQRQKKQQDTEREKERQRQIDKEREWGDITFFSWHSQERVAYRCYKCAKSTPNSYHGCLSFFQKQPVMWI